MIIRLSRASFDSITVIPFFSLKSIIHFETGAISLGYTYLELCSVMVLLTMNHACAAHSVPFMDFILQNLISAILPSSDLSFICKIKSIRAVGRFCCF